MRFFQELEFVDVVWMKREVKGSPQEDCRTSHESSCASSGDLSFQMAYHNLAAGKRKVWLQCECVYASLTPHFLWRICRSWERSNWMVSHLKKCNVSENTQSLQKQDWKYFNQSISKVYVIEHTCMYSYMSSELTIVAEAGIAVVTFVLLGSDSLLLCRGGSCDCRHCKLKLMQMMNTGELEEVRWCHAGAVPMLRYKASHGNGQRMKRIWRH